MEADQPPDGLGFGGVETKARRELQGNLRPDHAVIAAASPGDVVEQDRDVEDASRRDLPEDGARYGMILLELATLDLGEQAERADGMLVDRIVMIHVELHLGDDAAEVGDEAAEDSGLVHPAQDHVG